MNESVMMKCCKLPNIIMLIIALCFSSCNFDTDEKYDFSNDGDRTFMRNANANNLSAIKSSLLASSKGTNNDILQFARTAIAERTVAQAQLKAIADSKFITFALKDSVDEEQKRALIQLDTLTGRAFDSVYMYFQLNNNNKAVKNFNEEKATGRNPDLKKLADTSLVKVQTQISIGNNIVNTYFKR